MAEVKRRYDATGRREQARARRHAVVVAARALFERDGFRATTLTAIADRAGFSVEGIYKVFGSKAGLAKAVFDLAIAGDDEPVAVANRPEAEAVRAEPDVRAKLRRFASGLAARQGRSARVQILIRDGRHVDPSLEPVWAKLTQEARAGATILAEHLAATAGRDVHVERLGDVFANFFAIDHYERLVLLGSWSMVDYEQWLSRVLGDAFERASGRGVPRSGRDVGR